MQHLPPMNFFTGDTLQIVLISLIILHVYYTIEHSY